VATNQILIPDWTYFHCPGDTLVTAILRATRLKSRENPPQPTRLSRIGSTLYHMRKLAQPRTQPLQFAAQTTASFTRGTRSVAFLVPRDTAVHSTNRRVIGPAPLRSRNMQVPHTSTTMEGHRALLSTASVAGQNPAFRVERDTFGDINVPADKYWGAQTQRYSLISVIPSSLLCLIAPPPGHCRTSR